MANRPLATPEHYGGPGFDPLEYSPSHLPGDLDPVPDVTNIANPGASVLGPLIGIGAFALGLWVMSLFEGDRQESDQQEVGPMQPCANGHNNSLYTRTCTECGVLLPDPDLDGFGGM